MNNYKREWNVVNMSSVLKAVIIELLIKHYFWSTVLCCSFFLFIFFFYCEVISKELLDWILFFILNTVCGYSCCPLQSSFLAT